MIKWKLAVFAVGLLLASPLLLLNVWGIKTSMWAIDATRANEAALAGEAPKPVGKMPVSPFQWIRDNARVRAEFDQTAVNWRRSVYVSDSVAVEDLLTPGEASPDPAFAPLYAEARAARHLIGHCEDVLAKLGTKCAVSEASANAARDGSYTISARLSYAPSYDLGTPEKMPGGGLVTASTRLGENVSDDELPLNSAEARRGFMDQALAICESIRTRHGTCIINSISITRVVKRQRRADVEAGLPPPPVRLRATAQFTIYAKENRETQKAFREELTALAAAT
ncbi:hypothetical protein [Litoreibacter roseus]|uniref:Uncharacterized protein n=1 Tax=Litoreibacter roseus TaxID=2601869 RepID=A0A6N6JBM2_9RHOB|nr:hypothetical protein [Litoreibacter roseus]GFE63673.1 hypothetical protein KIN_07470 [Litoreibacter roseus]